jgi:hypothetical protein
MDREEFFLGMNRLEITVIKSNMTYGYLGL